MNDILTSLRDFDYFDIEVIEVIRGVAKAFFAINIVPNRARMKIAHSAIFDSILRRDYSEMEDVIGMICWGLIHFECVANRTILKPYKIPKENELFIISDEARFVSMYAQNAEIM